MKDNISKNDLELVDACSNGDLTAWSRLVKKYSPLIYAAIVNRLKRYNFMLPVEDIEDIKQDVLSSIWRERKLDGVRNRNDISFWLAIVSGNYAIEFMRNKRSSEPARKVSLFEPAFGSELADLLPSTGPNPADDILRDELMKRIESALSDLPPRQKMMVELHLMYGKKYNEISEMLSIPKGTVSSYLVRAKEKLKENLKDLQ